MFPERRTSGPPSYARWLLLTLLFAALILSSDVADGDSFGNALIDSLISFVIFGSGNLLFVALANGMPLVVIAGWFGVRQLSEGR